MQALHENKDFLEGDEEQRKELIGDEIYEFVEKIVGDNDAPKVTGMIIDLPHSDMKIISTNWAAFKEKVTEGLKLIKQSSNQ
jgi:hypothetical protein